MSLYVAALFYVLVPGIFCRFPKNGSKITVALVHAAIFGLVFFLTSKLVWRLVNSINEGFRVKCANNKICNNGKCDPTGVYCSDNKECKTDSDCPSRHPLCMRLEQAGQNKCVSKSSPNITGNNRWRRRWRRRSTGYNFNK